MKWDGRVAGRGQISFVENFKLGIMWKEGTGVAERIMLQLILREQGIDNADWMQLGQERGRGRAVLKMVLNLLKLSDNFTHRQV
jgi:hypothetical protein